MKTIKIKSIKAGKDAPVRKVLSKSFSSIVSWFTCPHCKKLVFIGEPEVIGALKKYKKQ